MKMVTAQEARNLTIAVIEDDIDGKLALVETSINQEIEKGKFNVILNGFLSREIKDVLIDNGYIIIETDNVMTKDGLQSKNHTNIMW